MSQRLKSDLVLLFVAAVWGTGFVAQRLAATQMDAFTFNAGRFLIAALVIFLAARLQTAEKPKSLGKNQLPWMMLAGVLLFVAAGLQQAGLATTTVGNAGFITGLYVVLVPLILYVVLRERVAWAQWLAVLIAVAGVGLLSLTDEFRLAPGDVLELAGAVIWALHVILVGRLAGQGADVMRFSAVQFATCGALNLGLAFALHPGVIQNLIDTWLPVLYSALIPIALGFTLQITGQKHAPAVDAAIILSTEAVFAALFGYLLLGELLGPRQILGCALILVAIVLAQVRPHEKLLLEAEKAG
jgi:drug/metabolite transporter (DMT)-like permease